MRYHVMRYMLTVVWRKLQSHIQVSVRQQQNKHKHGILCFSIQRVRESARQCETDFRCSYGSYNKTNEITPISQIYFWNGTLHVSDIFSVHHQESSTVHTTMVYVMQVMLTAC